MDSILNTIKSMLGIDLEEKAFDNDIIIHINSVLMNLTQLRNFSGITKISGESQIWNDLLTDDLNLEGIKSLMFLKVRLFFDPPASSFLLESSKSLISELEWRLTIQGETQNVE